MICRDVTRKTIGEETVNQTIRLSMISEHYFFIAALNFSLSCLKLNFTTRHVGMADALYHNFVGFNPTIELIKYLREMVSGIPSQMMDTCYDLRNAAI